MLKLVNESETERQSTAKRSRQDSAIEFFLSDSLGNGGDDKSPQDEVEIFLREPALGSSADSLKWWKANKHHFPIISKLANDCSPFLPHQSQQRESSLQVKG